MKYETNEIEIEYEGKPEKFTIRGLTFEEAETATEVATQFKFIGKTVQGTFKQKEFNMYVLKTGIVSGPAGFEPKEVGKLPAKVGKKLLEAIKILSNMDEEEKKVSGSEQELGN